MYPKALAAAAVLSLAVSMNAQIFNTSFEAPFLGGGPPFVGSWMSFSGSGAVAGQSGLFFRTGAQSLGLTIDSTPNTFAGAFQDVPSLVPGVSYTFSGWHAAISPPVGVGVEIRIEWRNSISNVEISRTPNLTPVPTATFSQFNLSAEVPVGANTARVVYAIQSFTGGAVHNGTVYVDDVGFTPVPEPDEYALLGGVGLTAFALLRRKFRSIA